MQSTQATQEGPTKFVIPLAELAFRFARSGGKGGQNVNKLSTKVELRWRPDDSALFSLEEKGRIKNELANRINKEGDLIVVAQEERTQGQNKARAIERLNRLLSAALVVSEERIATAPTSNARERRLKEKKQQAEKKKWRGKKIEV